MNHYTYKITIHNPTDERKYYIGLRSCKCLPEADTKYLGSSNTLKKWMKQNPNVIITKEIIAVWPTREEATNHEIQLHEECDVALNREYFNRSKATQRGFNGDWIVGKAHTEEHKVYLSVINSGPRHHQWGKPQTAEVRRKISESAKGRKTWNKGVPCTEEKKQMLSKLWKGRQAWNKGIPLTWRDQTGDKNHMFGKRHSEEHKQHLSNLMVGYKHKQVECPHCNKQGGETGMKKWHFDNCKTLQAA